MFNPLLDTVLDRTVVAGYTNAGYRIRRGMWNPADLQPMAGKVVLVTGATSGLGLAAAEGFARLGATVRVLARSEERGERARVRRSSHGQVTAMFTSTCVTSATFKRSGGSGRASAPRRRGLTCWSTTPACC
jgi:D-arabinose 1-dehydrogenase-like Zn-dependent alcohol dehydrogenase